ncbi:hypothetical protein AQUCO_00300425v1 [Aquilegia coerulea]|uniref:3'-5' exonuclease domain-containing protein n=1 Tax=Aquilegia coerulea TaxID=218851 RepID=A0A2G5EYU8_AQUCA|nr:hypothetical protein AQUCO_00300425v1 [Aquilegia coerulea]
MEVKIERTETEVSNIEDRYWSRSKERYELFTVEINSKRILTLYTACDSVMKKWISEVQKLYRKNKNTFPLIVSLCVDSESMNYYYSRKRLSNNPPYNVIALCIGSHCLLYSLPEGFYYDKSYDVKDIPKPLQEFLADSKAIFVGMDIGDVSKKLEKDQMLKVERCVDIRRLGEEVLGYPIWHMKEFSFDEIVKKMLDKRMEIERLEICDNWYDLESKQYDINKEYVKYLTVDAFFVYEMAVKYVDITTKLVSSSKKSK